MSDRSPLMYTPDGMYIEAGGALFKAKYYLVPDEIWNPETKQWEPYKGERIKQMGWGDVITEAELQERIDDSTERGKPD